MLFSEIEKYQEPEFQGFLSDWFKTASYKALSKLIFDPAKIFDDPEELKKALNKLLSVIRVVLYFSDNSMLRTLEEWLTKVLADDRLVDLLFWIVGNLKSLVDTKEGGLVDCPNCDDLCLCDKDFGMFRAFSEEFVGSLEGGEEC